MSIQSRPALARSLAALMLAALLAACSPLGYAPNLAPAAVGRSAVSVSERSAAFVRASAQGDPAVLFRTVGAAGALLFARHHVQLPLPSPAQGGTLVDRVFGTGQEEQAPAGPASLLLRFEGANPDTRVVAEDRLPGVVNTFVGSDPTGWRTGIATYATIVYEDLYPGIDLLYEGGKGMLKGTYAVAPGAEPGDVRWRYDGASEMTLRRGELSIRTAGSGEGDLLVERKPVAWQTVDGRRRRVRVRYVIHPDGSIGFNVGRYDASLPLLIDPTLDYSTYAGGADDEGSYGVAVDANGHVYIAGPTDSNTPPVDHGPGGGFDIFVTKLDPSKTGANQLVYETTIGGGADDWAYGLDVDANGNAYVVGYSDPATPPSFPVMNGLAGDANSRDAVALQLDAAGNLAFSSLLGGDAGDQARRVVEENGTMYLVGVTGSDNFPTQNPFQTDQGNDDAFVAAVDPSKTGAASLLYSTYYGGSEWDEGFGIDVRNGIITFSGLTSSDDQAGTPLPLKDPIPGQATYGGSSTGVIGDGFVAKLDPSQAGAAQLLFATYLGGSADENAAGVAVDAAGDVYVVGATESTDFPTTMGPGYGGGDWDGFLVKLRTNNSSIVFSRYVGGSGTDGAFAAALDALGNVYVAGGTGSGNFPTVNPIQGTFGGGDGNHWLTWLVGNSPSDAFVAKFDDAGTMTFGTFLGGSEDEAGFALALDASQSVYVTGGTESDDFAMVNPYQAAHGGSNDAFVAKIGQPLAVGGVVAPASLAARVLSGPAVWVGLGALVSLVAVAVVVVRRRRS